MPNFASAVKAVGEPRMDGLGHLLHIWGTEPGSGRALAPSTEAALGLLGATCCSG